MAQLPPKAPSHHMWPSSSPFQKLPSMAPFPASANNSGGANSNSWVDEFLDFSALRRGAHRRSVSDSIAFLEAPPAGDHEGDQFDRMNDETFMSMLKFDDMVDASNSPNSDPDSGLLFNSSNEKSKCEEDGESQECKANTTTAPRKQEEEEEEAEETKPEPLDPKRVKRILANRQSAQRSRVRKLQYISELERSVTTLQTEVSALSPRVAYLDHQRSVLTVGNSHLKQRIAALAQDRIFKDAHQEALKKELERLRTVYNQQNQNSSTSD